ncbi:MAG TPA: hypothetical protein VF071_00235 [Candidatus Limnocylindria bacterium]
MDRWRRAVLALLISGLVAGCAPEPIEPSVAVPVTDNGPTPTNACERAVVARAEHLRDHGAAGSEALEGDIFETCTYAEFQAANAMMADRYRYPGDGRTYVGRACARLFSVYRGTRLCQSR